MTDTPEVFIIVDAVILETFEPKFDGKTFRRKAYLQLKPEGAKAIRDACTAANLPLPRLSDGLEQGDKPLLSAALGVDNGLIIVAEGHPYYAQTLGGTRAHGRILLRLGQTKGKTPPFQTFGTAILLRFDPESVETIEEQCARRNTQSGAFSALGLDEVV